MGVGCVIGDEIWEHTLSILLEKYDMLSAIEETVLPKRPNNESTLKHNKNSDDKVTKLTFRSF